MHSKHQLLLSCIHLFCLPVPLVLLKQGWDFASVLIKKHQLLPAAGWTWGPGEQSAGPSPVTLYVLQQEEFKLAQEPFKLQRTAAMRTSFPPAQPSTNCVKSVSTQELLLHGFDIQVACLAHIYHKTPGTELSINDN